MISYANHNIIARELFSENKESASTDSITLSMEDIENYMLMHSIANANIPFTPESTNMMMAGILKKEYAFNKVFSPEVRNSHICGDIHCHNIDMIDRPYCSAHSPAYVAKFGLSLPAQNTAAKPAKHPEVLLEQLVKFAAGMQGHFSGAIGFDAVNTFVAPYIVGLSDERIKQLAQILIFEFSQQAVARGGQSLTASARLVVRDNYTKRIQIISIGDFCHKFIKTEGQKSFTDKQYETPSLNKVTGEIEWKRINGVFIHKPVTLLKEVELSGGRSVTVTEDHSLFSLNADGEFVEATAKDNLSTYLVAKQIPLGERCSYSYNTEDAWAIGAMIGDGYVRFDTNDQVVGATFFNKDMKVMERMSSFVKTKFNYKGKIQPSVNIFKITMGEKGGSFFYPIGRGSENKKIPVDLLSASDEIIMSLLSGMIDSDGSVSRNRFEYYTTSEELSAQLEFILNRLGFRYSLRIRNEQSNFNRNFPVRIIQICAEDSVKIQNTHSTRVIMKGETGNCSKHDFSIMREYLNKKYGTGVSSVDYTFRTSGRKIKYDQLMKLKEKIPEISKYENILPFEVKDIKDAEDEDFVYDIGVDDNENFVLANGIIAHNTIFSDLNLYWDVPKHYENVEAIGPGGVLTGQTYKDFKPEANAFMRALMQVYYEGDGSGRPFFFPKADCHVDEVSVQNEEYMNLLGKVASVKGSPYFIFDRGDDAQLALCCRLRTKLDKCDYDDIQQPWKLRFSAMQNVSLNLPAFAYQAKGNESKFLEVLDKNMRIAEIAHREKFTFIDRLLNIENGGPLELLNMNLDGDKYLKYDKIKFLIGIVGLNEAVQIICGQQMHESKEAYLLGLKIISHMNSECKKISEEFGYSVLLEQTPAETTAYRFAKLDIKRYDGDMKKYCRGDVDNDGMYYTNSTYMNITAPLSPIERVKMEGKFHPLIDAGAITHIWLGEHQPAPESIAAFVKKAYLNTSNSQIAFSPEFTSCISCNMTSRGLHEQCVYCGSESVQGMTRVTGYFALVQGFNKGKKAELKERLRVTL